MVGLFRGMLARVRVLVEDEGKDWSSLTVHVVDCLGMTDEYDGGRHLVVWLLLVIECLVAVRCVVCQKTNRPSRSRA